MANSHKTVQMLQEHLDQDERILYSVSGCYETRRLGSKTLRRGAFVATNIRLFFYAKKTFGFDMEVFPYGKISSIEMSKGLSGYRIRFSTSGNEAQVKFINSGDVIGFTNYVRSVIDPTRSPDLLHSSPSGQGSLTLQQPEVEQMSGLSTLNSEPVKQTIHHQINPNRFGFRLLKFIGWGISGFFLLGLLAGMASNPISTTLSLGVWALLFLPPIYRLTDRHGLFWNIFGRIVIFLLPPILMSGVLAPGKVAQIPAKPTPINQTREAPAIPKQRTFPTEGRKISRVSEGNNASERTVSAADFGDQWPLMVNEGRIRCDPPSIVTFTASDGRRYAINGTAEGAGVPKIDPIWKDSNDQYSPKVSLSPLIQLGLSICQKS